MAVYESIIMMLTFGIFIVALITLVVLVRHSKENNRPLLQRVGRLFYKDYYS